MADEFLSPRADQTILTTHIEVLARASGETGVVDGNTLTASSPASLVVHIAAGRIKIAGAPFDAEADTVTHTIGHETLPRIDIIYRDVAGAAQISEGTPGAIVDPKSLSDWKSYTSPIPMGDIPAGAILGAVWVPATCEAITTAYIWSFAGPVGDIADVIGTPGVDTRPPTEKATRSGMDARILHSLATAANDFLVASGSGVFVKKTLAEVKTILGLGTAAYTAATAYALAATGVTNGNTHDHTGGAGAAIDHGTLVGLGDDDHSAYHNNARGDARYLGSMTFGAGSGALVVATGIPDGNFFRAQADYTILGYWLAETSKSPIATTTVCDILKKASYPPATSDSICASAKPSLSNATSIYSTTLTGWTTQISAGDLLGFEVESNNNAKCLTLMLYLQRR